MTANAAKGKVPHTGDTRSPVDDPIEEARLDRREAEGAEVEDPLLVRHAEQGAGEARPPHGDHQD